MSNLVPEGWESKQLIECSFNGISNGVFCDPKNVGSGYKLINVYDMYQGYGVNVNLTRRLQLTEKEFLNNKVKYGDVFFTRSSLKLEGIAYCNINLSHDDDITYDGHLMKIRPNTELVNAEYLARYCLSDFARTYFMSTAKHSTMTTIAQADIAPLQVLLPPLPEQQKIAQILTSVDEVIEKTQAQIDKLKDLKTGMMQELLTKGIGHLEFKDSAVGRIPVGWEVETIEDLNISVLDGDRGKEYPKEKDFFQHEHCLFLSAKNVTKKGFRFDVSMFITEKKDNAMRKGKLKRGDIVITTRGTLGNIAYFNAEIPFENVRINSGMAIIRNDKTAVSTEFLNILLHSPLVNEQTELLAFGSAIPQLTIGLLKNLNIPVPSIEEQNKISAMINVVSHKIILIESKLTSLKNTKKALMQDLLTGKVRVKTEQSNSSFAVG
jgi:type I restriction enzyme S subunit